MNLKAAPIRLRDDLTAPNALRSGLLNLRLEPRSVDFEGGVARLRGAIAAEPGKAPAPANAVQPVAPHLVVRALLIGATAAALASVPAVLIYIKKPISHIEAGKIAPLVEERAHAAAEASARDSVAPSDLPLPIDVAKESVAALPKRQVATRVHPSESTDEDIARDVRALAALRAALAADPSRAISLAAEQRKELPRSRFNEERDALEILALTRSGNASAARARAVSFLARHPKSAYAERIRAATGAP